ncbi:hypothetical protein EDD16DRAFT_1521297 [Pisolithus croceorrhizus]|nr:hypothetical protein EDD16DRAFT_1521297 [Pisolithus croceorrhizus]
MFTKLKYTDTKAKSISYISSHNTQPYQVSLSLANLPPLQNSVEYMQHEYTIPQPLMDPLTAIAETENRLRAAATMIQVMGKESDVLVTHQTHHGASWASSQDRLCTFVDSMSYPLSLQQASLGNSRTTSIHTPSQLSLFGTDNPPKCHAPHGTYKKHINAVAPLTILTILAILAIVSNLTLFAPLSKAM